VSAKAAIKAPDIFWVMEYFIGFRFQGVMA
jgi:hypothetical protein